MCYRKALDCIIQWNLSVYYDHSREDIIKSVLIKEVILSFFQRLFSTALLYTAGTTDSVLIR